MLVVAFSPTLDLEERNIQTKEDRHENSFYFKQGKIERKALHISHIQQIFVDTYTLSSKRAWNRKTSDITVHSKVLHLVFPQRLSARAASVFICIWEALLKLSKKKKKECLDPTCCGSTELKLVGATLVFFLQVLL